jgi:hypothetical protein
MATNNLGATVAEAFKEIGALGRATVELIKARLSQDGTRLGLGLALLACALVAILGLPPLVVLAFVWGLIALGIWPWAAYLIAAGLSLILAAGLAVAGRSILKKAAASLGQTAHLVKGSLDALKGVPDRTGEGDRAASDTTTGPPED